MGFGDMSGDTKPDEPYPWIESLVNLKVLPTPAGYEKARPYEKGVVAIDNLKAARNLEHDFDVLRHMPSIVCEHAGLPCPPAESDVDRLPVFDTHEPTDAEPVETPKPEQSSTEPSRTEEPLVTLREFMKRHWPKMSSTLIDSRTNSLLAAARRGEVELPPHQENWRSGQSKKYSPSDLKQIWPELRRDWPGLPALKE